MEMSKIELYKMNRTQAMPNIKEIIGETVRPVAMIETEYANPDDGEIHNVLALKLEDGRYYRTEVAAFREAFKVYWDFFSEDEQKPEILIVGKSSRKGNEFVNFDVVG